MYDQYEIWAMHKTPLRVVSGVGEKRRASAGYIADLISEDSIEYMILSDQSKIRLDEVITLEADGKIQDIGAVPYC